MQIKEKRRVGGSSDSFQCATSTMTSFQVDRDAWWAVRDPREDAAKLEGARISAHVHAVDDMVDHGWQQIAAAYREHPEYDANAAPSLLRVGKPKQRECPLCTHRWVDKYRKDECPKCLQRLSHTRTLPEGRRREPGEPSTWKAPPSSSMESEYGQCPFGGRHMWRFGRCRKCGEAEGEHLAEQYARLRLSSEVHVLRAGPEEPPSATHWIGDIAQRSSSSRSPPRERAAARAEGRQALHNAPLPSAAFGQRIMRAGGTCGDDDEREAKPSASFGQRVEDHHDRCDGSAYPSVSVQSRINREINEHLLEPDAQLRAETRAAAAWTDEIGPSEQHAPQARYVLGEGVNPSLDSSLDRHFDRWSAPSKRESSARRASTSSWPSSSQGARQWELGAGTRPAHEMGDKWAKGR